jgi:hypothetical protein
MSAAAQTIKNNLWDNVSFTYENVKNGTNKIRNLMIDRTQFHRGHKK